MQGRRQNMQNESTVLEEPRLAKLLFADTRLAWLWLPLRLFLGWEWLEAGWHKYTDPAWFQNGEALMKYWQRGLQLKPKPVIAVDWYRDFIQFLLDTGSYTWFSKLVIFGELAIGIALILGVFTGIAAFMGGFMNWNFIMAGSASTNGLLFAISTWLVLAWRNAGWIGLDRWLLPLLGTPWKPGRLFRVNREATVT
jgi:thiosulfate dehydrogenase [quinone] large subunit